jgi:hypothetical protein
MLVSSTLPVSSNCAAAMKMHSTQPNMTTLGTDRLVPYPQLSPLQGRVEFARLSDGDREAKFVAEMATVQQGTSPTKLGAAPAVIVVFVCENSVRAGRVPTSGKRHRPQTPEFGWPFPVQEVVVPCAGRLQPEHFLKAFEAGADAVGVVCCEEGNCHHHEGKQALPPTGGGGVFNAGADRPWSAAFDVVPPARLGGAGHGPGHGRGQARQHGSDGEGEGGGGARRIRGSRGCPGAESPARDGLTGERPLRTGK